MAEHFIKMRGISKSFPGVLALDRVDLEVLSGEVHAILGENGAGKSTLMKVLSGVHAADSGEIRVDGETCRFHNISEAETAGITMIHQELNLIDQLTVAENIVLGQEPVSRLGWIRRREMHSIARQALGRLGVAIPVTARVGDLKVGEQQLVEIARALSRRSRLVIMDEPTSALSDSERENLFQVIRQLKRENVAVIYISHKLEEIFSIADRVTVLRDGCSIVTQRIEESTRGELINRMVGRELDELFPKVAVERGEELLSVKNLSLQHPRQRERKILDDISLELHRGEILGIAGLMGAGRSELLLTLFGAPPGKITSGSIRIAGANHPCTSPADAITRGIVLVTEDRKSQGLFLPLTVRSNITIAALRKTLSHGIIRNRLENRLAGNAVERLRIRTPSLAHAVETLSGGNQQKVILAKWLLTDPQILLLDDPTRGI
ncbi:sugar ABC transporter ATP-binding protein, partial [candidate division KSB1 bacterium]|nr:sugar ABC transporter ATP-binding protein [candidate division KSB1 bacterium]